MNSSFEKLRVSRLNPYHSITRVVLSKPVDKQYIGVKDVVQIPQQLIEKIESTNDYVHHTYDAHAWGGRAIDINIKHPITGSYMTGSSSGTAVNVFCGINDVGIGTDGGGSILAPAMCLNLFAFVCPLIEQDYTKQFLKKSTDGISFTPSIGFITRSYDTLKNIIQIVLPIQDKPVINLKILGNIDDDCKFPFFTEKKKFPNIFGNRNELISFLLKSIKEYDVIISREGPIDVNGIGDSIYGAYGGVCANVQQHSRKGLLRAVNMANATAICIPDTAFATGYVLICESTAEKINNMLMLGNLLKYEQPSIVRTYFSNLQMYEE